MHLGLQGSQRRAQFGQVVRGDVRVRHIAAVGLAPRTVRLGRTGTHSLKVALEVKPTETVPAITLELKGQATFFIDEGVFAER